MWGRFAIRKVVRLAIVVALIAASALAWPGSVSAGSITAAIKSVTTTPADPGLFDPITTTLAWQVPDGSHAGDTFSMTLPEQLNQLPASFPLRDPAGNLVATATIDSIAHVVTFTLTSFVEDHQDVHGTAFFSSHLDSTMVSGGQTVPLTYTTDASGTVFTNTLTVRASPGTDRTIGEKYGEFTRGDQGTLDPTDALKWYLESPAGPFDAVTFTDHAESGQEFDCAGLSARVGNFGGANNNFVATGGFTGYTVESCSPSALKVSFPAMTTSGGGYQLAIPTTITDPAATSFANTASVATTIDGTQYCNDTTNIVRQGNAGGDGSGQRPTPAVAITKADTAGNAADTADTSVSLPEGRSGLVYTVRNTGQEALTDVVVSDKVDSTGNGVVSDLSCDWSAYGGPATGTSWAGPLPRGASVTCTATLTGVQPAPAMHEDTGMVVGVGLISCAKVEDTNPYYAYAPTTPPTSTPPTSPPPSSTPPTSTPPSSTPPTSTPPTSTPPTSTPPVSVTPSGPPSTTGRIVFTTNGPTPPPGGGLAFTGSTVILPLAGGLALLAGGGLLLALVRRGRGSHAG